MSQRVQSILARTVSADDILEDRPLPKPGCVSCGKLVPERTIRIPEGKDTDTLCILWVCEGDCEAAWRAVRTLGGDRSAWFETTGVPRSMDWST